MSDDDLRIIAERLRGFDRPGEFAASHRESALGLGVDVAGVGACRLPLDARCVEALVGQAVRSPFGYGERTLRDRSVRDSWEIPASKITLDPATWSTRLDRGVRTIATALGFPPDVAVTPKLQKLLVYERGQFFAPHRDSEKEPDTVATLVVVLPGHYEGGEVVVSHAGQRITFSTAEDGRANALSFLGFYADCLHETRPVVSGSRVALTYSLQVESTRSHSPTASELLVELERDLEAYFRDEEREWLVHLLDHQYSRRSLDWDRLKNADQRRAEALRRASEAIDCDCFLALADASETYDLVELGDADEDEDGGGHRIDPALPARQPWHRLAWPPSDDLPELETWPGDFLAIDEPPDAELAVGRLLDRQVQLVGWVDESGEPCVGPDASVDDTCVVTAVEPHGWTSYEMSGEPWTGNEGGTAEKWYHLAAVVVVPRDRWSRPQPARPPPRGPLRRPRSR